MGDPCLVAGDRICIAVAHRPGAQAAQIRACVGFCENGCGQNFGRSDFGEPLVFLVFGAPAQDQLGGDF